MQSRFWIDEVFGNVWRIRILRMLSRDPGRMWTERELARALQAAPNTVNLAVRSLRDAGVLEFRRIGRSNAIRLNQNLYLVQRIGDIFQQESVTWDHVRSTITGATPRGVASLLFGSVARGDEKPGSDLDLLVVASDQETAEQVAGDIRAHTANVFPLNLSIAALGAKEFRRKRKEAWLSNALRDGQPMSETTVEAFA